MPDGDSKSSRIAIQLGTHAIKQRARPAHGKRHRAQELHEDSQSDDNSDNDQQTKYGRHEAITSFEVHGSSLEQPGRKSQKERTPPNQNGNPDQDKEDNFKSRHDGGVADSSESQDKPVKWGLTINMKGTGGDKDKEKGESKSRIERSDSEDPTRKEKVAKSIDDEAMDALMGSSAPKRKHTDSDAADRDPRPEDYESVPIDDFGAHLLRNFGWDGKMRGKVREVNRHANLTGLGAKDAKGAEDLGAWNQKTAKDSRPMRLDDYRREESKKRQRTDDRYRDSYKRERERERERERGRDR
jgi:hypothetical protein